ncbi:MAG: hypothetical protein KC501_22480 [Myxococcales bacterium]|nr:hypothetical protein [Myxococcales bacterium]
MDLSHYVTSLQEAFPKGGEIQEEQRVIENVLGVDPKGLREALFALYVAGYVTVKPHYEGDIVAFTVSWSA